MVPYRETLLIDHNALIQNGTVVQGNPDASELYNRLLTTDAAKRMPLGQPQLSAQAIDTIRNWILAGAPDWAAASYNRWRLYLSCRNTQYHRNPPDVPFIPLTVHLPGTSQ